MFAEPKSCYHAILAPVSLKKSIDVWAPPRACEPEATRSNDLPGVGVEKVVLADPKDARELLVVAGHQTGFGGLLPDLSTSSKPTYTASFEAEIKIVDSRFNVHPELPYTTAAR